MASNISKVCIMKLPKFGLPGFLSPGVTQYVKLQAPPTGEKTARKSNPLLDVLARRVNGQKSDSMSTARDAIHSAGRSVQARPARPDAGAGRAGLAGSSGLSPEILTRLQALKGGPVPPKAELFARFEALKHPPVRSKPESVAVQSRPARPDAGAGRAGLAGLAESSGLSPQILTRFQALKGGPVPSQAELFARFEALKHSPIQSKPEPVADLHTLLQELKKSPGPTHAAAVPARRAAVPKLSVQQARAQGLATPSRPAPPIPFGGTPAEFKQLRLQYRDAPIMFRRTNSGVAQKLSMPELGFFTSKKNNLQTLLDKRASLTTNLQSLHGLIENNRSAPHDLGKIQQFMRATRSEIKNLRDSDRAAPGAATRQQILALATQLKQANAIAQDLESIVKQAPLSMSLFNDAQALLGKVNQRIGSYR
jgi:hypothetical protein